MPQHERPQGQRVEDLLEHAVLRDLGELLLQRDVGPEVGIDILRLGVGSHLFQPQADVAQLLVGRALDDEPDHAGQQIRANQVDIADVRGRDDRDPRPAASLDGHQALLLEQHEGLADRGAARAESLSQVHAVQVLTGSEIALDDADRDPFGDLGHLGLAPVIQPQRSAHTGTDLSARQVGDGQRRRGTTGLGHESPQPVSRRCGERPRSLSRGPARPRWSDRRRPEALCRHTDTIRGCRGPGGLLSALRSRVLSTPDVRRVTSGRRAGARPGLWQAGPHRCITARSLRAPSRSVSTAGTAPCRHQSRFG